MHGSGILGFLCSLVGLVLFGCLPAVGDVVRSRPSAANPVASNMTSLVRFAVEGQMPVYPRGRATPSPELKDFFLQWTRLYRGAARDVLMHGRHVKAPRLTGEGSGDVFVSAFGLKDTPEAVVLGNGEATPRTCSFTAFGRRETVTLRPYELRVLRNELTSQSRFLISLTSL